MFLYPIKKKNITIFLYKYSKKFNSFNFITFGKKKCYQIKI